MRVEIIGAESFGVRSMCCRVVTDRTAYLIDPGLSLAPRRHRLPPHPIEIEAAAALSDNINAAARCTDVIVITHFHHDHFTPFYEHEYSRVSRDIYVGRAVYIKSYTRNINRNQRRRALHFVKRLGSEQLQLSDGAQFGELRFSPAFPHGEPGRGITVIMACIADGQRTFVHGSDIQCIPTEAIDWILAQRPDVVFVSGPPIYISHLSPHFRAQARANILRLVERVPVVIVDHHLPRSLDWSSYLSEPLQIAGQLKHRLLLAAEFMNQQPQLLEAQRKQLYQGT